MSFTSWATIGALTKYRTTKFKQRRQVFTRFKHLENVQIGGCTGLSFGWLQRYFKCPDETGSARIAILNTDQYWINIDYLASIFNSDLKDKKYLDRIKTVTLEALHKTVTAHVFQISKTDFSRAIDHFDSNPGAHMIVLKLVASTDHLCAAFQTGTSLIFFDPNSGEYTVPNASRSNFFEALHTQYLTYVQGDGKRSAKTIQNFLICHVA